MKRKANNDDDHEAAAEDGLRRRGREGKGREVDDEKDGNDADCVHDEDRFDPMTASQTQQPPRKKRGPANEEGDDEDIYGRTKNRPPTRAAHRRADDTRTALTTTVGDDRKIEGHPGNGRCFTDNVTSEPQLAAAAAAGMIRRLKNLQSVDGTGAGAAGVGRLEPVRRSWIPRQTLPSNTINSVRGRKGERFQALDNKPRRFAVEKSNRSSLYTSSAAMTTLDSDSLRVPSDETVTTDGSRTSRTLVGPRTSISLRIVTSMIGMIVVVVAAGIRALTQDAWKVPAEMGRVVRHPHIRVPRRRSTSLWRRVLPRSLRRLNEPHIAGQGNVTLRQVLSDPSGYHLAMAPAFFGFYGYFGALAAWEEEVGRHVLEPHRLLSVAGASAGAMTAVLLASQIPPRTAASFVSTMTVDKFADFPGILAAFRGNKFEAIMEDFLRRHAVVASPERSTPAVVQPPQMQDSRIPVAVSAFDIQSLTGRILRTGSMARAARASATFPFLFQPVGYHVTSSSRDDKEKVGTRYLLIDGGLTDFAGLQGTKDVLSRVATDKIPTRHTVINLSVGNFLGAPPGPAYFDEVNGTALVVSISLQRLPACGPWAMSNGPKAVEASLKAMQASLDVPLFLGRDPNHYELHIDTRGFWKHD